MILPILAYGHSLLRQKCNYIDNSFPDLEQLIGNMWETMQQANGCGLAAPQIGQSIRLFIVDSQTTFENFDKADREHYFDTGDGGIKETFINANIIKYSDDYREDQEGCLSIPGLSQTVNRPWSITIEYDNQQFEKQVRTFSGATARMIQHEYDHTEGILYLDHLSPLIRRFMASKLKKIVKGQIRPPYSMKFI